MFPPFVEIQVILKSKYSRYVEDEDGLECRIVSPP